jgi:hypothetical protein
MENLHDLFSRSSTHTFSLAAVLISFLVPAKGGGGSGGEEQRLSLGDYSPSIHPITSFPHFLQSLHSPSPPPRPHPLRHLHAFPTKSPEFYFCFCHDINPLSKSLLRTAPAADRSICQRRAGQRCAHCHVAAHPRAWRPLPRAGALAQTRDSP